MAEERPMRIDLGSDAPDPPTALIAPLRARATTAGLWRERDARRGERLLTPGDPPAVIVLSGGLVKLSYIAPAGDEWIKSFVADAGAFGAIEEESVPYAATCLEPSRVAALPAAWVRAALAEPALAARCRRVQRLAPRPQARAGGGAALPHRGGTLPPLPHG
jgi:hypothetical protein